MTDPRTVDAKSARRLLPPAAYNMLYDQFNDPWTLKSRITRQERFELCRIGDQMVRNSEGRLFLRSAVRCYQLEEGWFVLEKEEPTTMPFERMKLDSGGYRLNRLVAQAEKAREKDHVGRCAACGCPVSAYHNEETLRAVRPDAITQHTNWEACDNADCANAYGVHHPAFFVVRT